MDRQVTVESSGTMPGRTRSTWLAAFGVALGLAGVLGYFFAVFRLPAWPGIRNDAMPNWLLVAAGLGLSIWAATRAMPGRRLLPTLLIGLNVLIAGAFADMLYVVPAVPAAEGPGIGTTAPDFALLDQSGKTLRLSDFRGAPLLLVFYRGHW
jgi:AhpC/TSA family